MGCRIVETEKDVSFTAQCNCTGEWSDLAAVEGAKEGFPSWNYLHGLGGFSLQCVSCEEVYVLGGRAAGLGLPDLIPVKTLNAVPHRALTTLQRRTLDISLMVEELLWLKSMDLLRAANLVGHTVEGKGFWIASMNTRGMLQREKTATIRTILNEHGIDGVPETLRIARTSDGGGCIYSVDRGPLPGRSFVGENQEGAGEIHQRVVDLSV